MPEAHTLRLEVRASEVACPAFLSPQMADGFPGSETTWPAFLLGESMRKGETTGLRKPGRAVSSSKPRARHSIDTWKVFVE